MPYAPQDPEVMDSHIQRYRDEENGEPPRRQFKYSTANMKERSTLRKWIAIASLFLLAIAVMVGLSMLISKLFFNNSSSSAPPVAPQRNASQLFHEFKVTVDKSCSSIDDPFCNSTCVPDFLECCDPFNDYEMYDYSTFSGTRPPAPENTLQCSFANETEGCMSYAKCQALSKLVDPAPGTLPILCSAKQILRDGVACQELCQPAAIKCCYATTGNCLADNFDICLDYAPCQNLRNGFTVETAPDDLDQACFYQLPVCYETCQQAACCMDKTSKCYQDNFLSCMTYAPCTNATDIKIEVAPMFGVLEKPPKQIDAACSADNLGTADSSGKTCQDYCRTASCCFASEVGNSCFRQDPLGCLAWKKNCQVVYP